MTPKLSVVCLRLFNLCIRLDLRPKAYLGGCNAIADTLYSWIANLVISVLILHTRSFLEMLSHHIMKRRIVIWTDTVIFGLRRACLRQYHQPSLLSLHQVASICIYECDRRDGSKATDEGYKHHLNKFHYFFIIFKYP